MKRWPKVNEAMSTNIHMGCSTKSMHTNGHTHSNLVCGFD